TAAGRESSRVSPAETVSESIGRQAGRGLRWSLLGTMTAKVGSFAMGLVLARLLSPADFGTYAIALAATTILMNINDVGLIAATVQWRGRLADMAPTAGTMAAVFGVVIYGVFWLGAPLFSAAAGDRAAASVVRILTLVIVIDGLTAVRSGALMREFKQDKLIVANTVGLAANAAIAIALASQGAGAYSFAWGQLAGAAATGVLVFVFAKVPVRFGFDRAVAAKLMRFGIPLAASLGVDAVVMNVQFMIIGRLVGATVLGYFLLAFNMSIWAQTVLGTAIRYVSVAGFSRLSEGDEEELSSGVQRSMAALVTVVAPIVALTSALAAPLVQLLYGERWVAAIPALRILVILTLGRMLIALATDALMGAGATRATLWLNLAWAAALIPALWVGTKLDGIRGAATAQIVIGFFLALPLAAYALRRIRVDLSPLPPLMVRPLIGTLLAAAVAFAVTRVAGPYPVVRLIAGGGAGLLVYLPVAVPRHQLRQVLDSVRRRRQPAGALAE
ncbi:MAG TPA: oligosaccharide flippase family protein, partial [Rugosimonospora sp.]|nr:oligosaccharide flippase family protein [Rugosimonospora sp.]